MHADDKVRKVSLIGAPTDIGAGDRGARMGPEALRIAGLAEALRGAASTWSIAATSMVRAIRGSRRSMAIGIWMKSSPGIAR